MLVTARLQVRVGQMHVTELGRQDRVSPEDIDLAGPGVTGIQRHIAHIREVLGQVAALPPDTEHARPAALGHVLDGHDDTLLPRLAQGSGLPTLQRSARRWWMRHYYRYLHPARQSRNPHQGFFSIE